MARPKKNPETVTTPSKPVQKENTPEGMAKGMINASFGHINENQTFTTKPPSITENTTTVEDLNKNKNE